MVIWGLEKSSGKSAYLVFLIKPETKWANYGQAETFKKIEFMKAELVYVAKYWDEL